jgi:polysaccharide export outer membrane protein
LLLVRTVLLGSLLALVGCASVPSGAPTTSELLSKEDNGKATSAYLQNYELFDLDAEVAAIAGKRVWETLVGRLPRSRATSPRLGVGDAVAIAMFSAPETSIAGGAKNVTLPNVTVDNRGFLRIPYTGLIKAAGRTPREIEFAIEARLKGRAIDPQAVVTLLQNRSSLVTVAGLVKGPNRFPIGVANERLVDMIAKAGGLTIPDHAARIRVVRSGRSASVSMNTVIARPRENIFVRQGDTIFVEKAPRYVTLLGAASRNSEIPFKDEHMTMAQVLGLAGGLMDTRADPTGVFIFRYENENVLRRLRPESQLLGQSSRPVIYRLNLKRADGYFVAQKFQMRNRDLVFISNAQGTQLQKFLNLVGTALGQARGVTSTAISVSN